jgi:excisionase family DNA binding protein
MVANQTETEQAARSDRLLTRAELAEALQVSLSTVDRLLADEEITPVMLRRKLVRFYLPDVLGGTQGRTRIDRKAMWPG